MKFGWNDGDSDDAFGGNGINIIFRDAILNTAIAFALLAVIFIALANPPGAEEEKRKTVPPGNVIVEIYWDDKLNTDVDLWVRGPDGIPVGFSNLVGVNYNLLRDDLGIRENDPVNYESTFSRGLPAGEHCVNVHLFSNASEVLPIKVKATVKIAKGEPGTDKIKGGDKPVLVSDVSLTEYRQELNVFCFNLDENGDIVKNSVYRSQSVHLFYREGQ